jgi:ubiquinone/menaquinone biosynthesis C-methylase UbiE
MPRRIAALLACALGLLLAPGAFAGAAADRYVQGSSSVDGTGKSHQGREIAKVMGWQATPWLEREEREQEERTSLLISELGLAAGMVVADVGAGSGYLSRRMSPLVLPGGRVIATDIQPEMLALLAETAKDPRYANIQPLRGAVDDTGLAPGTIDLAIMVDVYHELEYPYEVLASIVRALKPGGRVAFVEYRGEDPAVPIKALHKMTERQIRLEAAQHALTWERTSRRLPWQHLVIFRKAHTNRSRVLSNRCIQLTGADSRHAPGGAGVGISR